MAVLILALAVLAARAVLGGEQARAQAGQCGEGEACTMLIEVAGLQPQDLTREKTPNLWSLAHPGESLGISQPGRSGFIWQAPRAAMTTSPAAASASLLSGGFARETGVPADHYEDDQAGEARLGGGSAASPVRFRGVSTPDLAIDPLPALIAAQAEDGGGTNRVMSAIGDPEINDMLRKHFDTARRFDPSGDPSLCPVPEDPTSPQPPDPEQGGPAMPMRDHPCAVRDMETLNAAFDMLNSPTATSNVIFSYIHLAELGKVKQRGGDVDQALASLDAAVGTFIQRLHNQPGAAGERFRQTVLFLVGSHGYEQTLPALRVPHPDAGPGELWNDLDEYVNEELDEQFPGLGIQLFPQGTVATVYVTGGTRQERQAARDEIHRRLSPDGDDLVNQHPLCQGVVTLPTLPQAVEEALGEADECIADVLYMSPELKADGKLEGTVEGEHPTWRLDHLDVSDEDCRVDDDDGSLEEGCVRTGTSGDLLILMGEGWASGRAVTSPLVLATERPPIVNPYPFSSGGPRNRAVAALVNGPTGIVRQFDPQPADPTTHPPGHPERVERLPVTDGPSRAHRGDITRDANNSRYHPQSMADFLSDPTPAVERANTPDHETGRVIDDDGHVGHESQPRTVDFAVTIAALMKIGMPPQNISETRILQEAFINPLSLPFEEEDIGEALPDDPIVTETRPAPPALPAQPIIIQPPDPDVFDFEGLIRKVTARVTDRHGRNVSELRGLARLNHVELRADFGRPQSQVHLTLYRRDRVGRTRRARLRPIVRFEPFEVERGEQVRLRFQLPRRFRPSHIGIAVREAVSVGDDLRPIGPMDGGIVRLRDASNLHRVVAGGAVFTRVMRAARAYDFWLRSHRFATRALERAARGRGPVPEELRERHARASELRTTRRRELGSAVTELRVEMRRWLRQGRLAMSVSRRLTRSIDRARARGRRPALRHVRVRSQARTVLKLRNGQLMRGHVLLRRLESRFGRR